MGEVDAGQGFRKLIEIGRKTQGEIVELGDVAGFVERRKFGSFRSLHGSQHSQSQTRFFGMTSGWMAFG